MNEYKIIEQNGFCANENQFKNLAKVFGDCWYGFIRVTNKSITLSKNGIEQNIKDIDILSTKIVTESDPKTKQIAVVFIVLFSLFFYFLVGGLKVNFKKTL